MGLGPLAGYAIGITADRRADEQAELLQRRGARIVHGPTIRTLPLWEEQGLRDATDRLILEPPDVVVLITGLGTRSWFAAAESLNLGEALHAALHPAAVYARGPKAAGAAITAGLELTWKAPNSRTQELIDQVIADHRAGLLPGSRVAVQLDGSSDTRLQDQLLDAGLDVVPVPIYRWTFPEDPQPAVRLLQSVADQSVDAVTFTAGPAVANFVSLAEEHGLLDDVRGSCNSGHVAAVCVGPICAERARSFGLVGTIEPVHPRLGAMVQACAASFTERQQSWTMGGHAIVVQGRLVVVDEGDAITLSDRERRVLQALAVKPGAVQSKASLLRTVWGNNENDEHVVEVTIGRLRQRLGAAGAALETVVRRGYRLAPD